MMDYPSIEQLLEKAAEEGGAIVCSVRCNSTEIDEAQAEGRMTVTDAGYGFIWRPNEDAELAALRAKAAAFDWMAAQLWSVQWEASLQTLYIEKTSNEIISFAAPTLAEAVQLAMEAEGER